MRAGSLAMRVGDGTQTKGLYWLLSDHLGSTAITTDSSGNKSGEVRYKAWGETRFTSGSTPTTFRFTGQRQEEQLGLYFYNARWYDPSLSRFIQADTDVPESQDGKGLDRYAYVANNPVVYDDSSGHCWGVAKSIRGVPSYDTTCNNLDMALEIVHNPNANAGQKTAAGGYIAAEAIAHTGLVIGVAGLACSAVVGCVKVVEGALGIGAGVSADGDPTNEATAVAKTAESVVDKLSRYLLNPNHPRGNSMATWYEQALGFTQKNMGDLAKQIVFDPKTAYVTEVTRFGTKYNQIITITGANGKEIDVVAAWIKLADGTIKLVTTVPAK